MKIAKKLIVPEHALHVQVVAFLRIALPAEAVLHHSPNEGARGWRAQANIKKYGTMAGWPDLEILYGGKAYFIELKREGENPSPTQKETHRLIRNAGCDCFVAHSLDDVQTALNFWAIPFRSVLTRAGA